MEIKRVQNEKQNVEKHINASLVSQYNTEILRGVLTMFEQCFIA